MQERRNGQIEAPVCTAEELIFTQTPGVTSRVNDLKERRVRGHASEKVDIDTKFGTYL